ncbi:MAG: GvpL/GvpF family gas vesicle protein [Syntrophobacteraceae bacterium]
MLDNIDSEAIYLYCFASSTLVSTVEGVGVDGRNPVFLLPYRDVVAVAGFVSREEFGGHAAEDRMRELAWVGPRACRHEEVVERVLLHSPVLPVRFGTIFDSQESLEDRLKRHHDAIRGFLGTVSGKDEWAVKGLLDRARAVEQSFKNTREARSGELPPSPGALYLEEQRMRAACQKDLNRSLEEVCRSVTDDLSCVAVDWSMRKTLTREAMGGEKDMVLNCAFLVPRDAVSDFCARVRAVNDECAVPNLFFELSGPWPPYSFCPSLEEETPP